MFRAIVIERDEQGYRASLKHLQESALPAGDVTVRVQYSTLNYKDGLAITGKGPIVRSFPMVPGIDFAGFVTHSSSPAYREGDAVILNGWGVGEQRWGGLAEVARVKADWLIRAPDGVSVRDAMAVGTAGYTAMLCVMALERAGLTPSSGPVLVTGANGGVGSFTISFLHRLGYTVVAATGRPDEAAHLMRLGASEVIARDLLSKPGKPLQKEQWAGAVDSVGSHTLANVCAGMKSDGVVTACGMAQGLDFPASVAPFILRGVSLLGINSVTRPYAERIDAWQRISRLLDKKELAEVTREIPLSEAIGVASELIAGRIRGRVVVNVAR